MYTEETDCRDISLVLIPHKDSYLYVEGFRCSHSVEVESYPTCCSDYDNKFSTCSCFHLIPTAEYVNKVKSIINGLQNWIKYVEENGLCNK